MYINIYIDMLLKGDKMDIYKPVKQMLKVSGKKMADLCKDLGVSLQSMNASLHGNMSLDKFVKVVEKSGCVLLIGVYEDGVLKPKSLERLRKEWDKEV